MKRALLVGTLLILAIAGCSSDTSLKGTWQYDGGIYNGTPRVASPEMVMQRIYTANSYEAFVTNPDGTKTKYGAGSYEFKGDSVQFTSKFSNQPSQLLNKAQRYAYKFEGARFITSGVLPNGMVVEEYWKKVK